jgi:hypothetical protein
MTTSEPKIQFSNEESKSSIRYKLGQSLTNLIELTKSTVKHSESSELFKTCVKNFAQNDTAIENSCEKFKKIEIIATQLNYQVDTIISDCQLLKEVCEQIDSIQRK